MKTLITFALLLLLLAGCAHQAGRDIVAAQTPGQASGAGATFTGPANSAAASTQKATKTTVYQRRAPAAGRNGSIAEHAAKSEPAAPSPEALLPEPPAPPLPAWVHEHTETTFGEHQDAAGIVKVALAASRWGAVRWIGLLCILGCIGGLLWSAGNEQGYPLVFWKLGGVGLFLVMVAENPLWLLLLILPIGFYAVQKLNLLRLP